MFCILIRLTYSLIYDKKVLIIYELFPYKNRLPIPGHIEVGTGIYFLLINFIYVCDVIFLSFFGKIVSFLHV